MSAPQRARYFPGDDLAAYLTCGVDEYTRSTHRVNIFFRDRLATSLSLSGPAKILSQRCMSTIFFLFAAFCFDPRAVASNRFFRDSFFFGSASGAAVNEGR